MAKTRESFKGSVGTAWGQPLKDEHKNTSDGKAAFDYTAMQWDASDYDLMVAAGELPKPKAIVKMVNDSEKNTARQSAQDELLISLGYIKPTTENNDQLRLKNMYVMLRQSGDTHDEAVAASAKNCRTEWDKVPADGDIKWTKLK